MELKYGNKRAFEISLITALFVCAGTYAATHRNIGMAFGMLMFTLLTFPGVLRFFLCSNWRKIDASIIKIEDLSNIRIDWRGSASLRSNHKINIEYSVGGKSYNTNIFLGQPVKDHVSVYYKPKNPEVISAGIGLGWEGTVFISVFILLGVYHFFPDFFIFDVIESFTNSMTSLKNKL